MATPNSFFSAVDEKCRAACTPAAELRVAFEGIQSAIFDHLIAMVPVFGLRIFQAENAFSEPDAIARLIEPLPGTLRASGVGEPGST